MEKIQAYPWPGNVRELRNVVERAVYRWGVPDSPIEDIQFDPFDSPWAPLADERRQSASAANRNVPALAGPTSHPPAEILPPLTSPSHDPESCADFRLAVAEYEKEILAAALEKCRWNQRAAAQALKLSYDQLRHALKRHELQG